MRVLKFGGTSVANAERITHVANIVQTKLQENTLLVVVSAMAGITDTLESLLSLVELISDVLDDIFSSFISIDSFLSTKSSSSSDI